MTVEVVWCAGEDTSEVCIGVFMRQAKLRRDGLARRGVKSRVDRKG